MSEALDRPDNSLATQVIAASAVCALTAEFFGSYVRLRWDWSATDRVVIGWCRGERPERREDSRARWRTISYDDYRRDGGLRLPLPPGKWSIQVWSDDALAETTVIVPAANVEYRVRRRRRWDDDVVLIFRSDVHISLPEIIVVCSPNDVQPQDVNEGEEIGRIANVLLAADEARSFTFRLPLVRPAVLRAFFASPAVYEEVHLIDPQPSEARLR
jgi:hypothetical protein